MREQFKRALYNHLIKKLNIPATFHYQKVKNTTFNKFFQCIQYLGFYCISFVTTSNLLELLQ